VILDGGVATELPQRVGQDRERLWGIEAIMSEPDRVVDVHRRYVAAGVDVITTNTWALPTLLDGDGHLGLTARPLHWMQVARRGVRLAREAAASSGRADECAVAFSLNGDLDRPDGAEMVSFLTRALSSDAPDLILLETLSVLRPSLFEVVDALLETGIALWVSFRRCRHGLCGVYGQHWGGPEGDVFGRAARRLEEMGIAALLVNCIPPDHVDGIVSYLRDFTDLPLGVYPNLGYYTSAGWRFESKIGGPEYAEMAVRWRAEGAQIIGGCCGTRPEHITAARDALAGTNPGQERRDEPPERDADRTTRRSAVLSWDDRRHRRLHPLDFPAVVCDDGVLGAIPGTYLTWRYLFEQGVGAHQRCLDIGCGAGLQTVQLALNGAAHVHAIDIDQKAVANTRDNAFRNGVTDRVSVEVSDLYPWLPQERYELIVANLPQIPVDPLTQLSSHRPVDFWGRGLVDQVIRKLPDALALEGRALLTVTSLLSREQTAELLDDLGLSAEVVAWDLEGVSEGYLAHREHHSRVEHSSDGYLLHLNDQGMLVCYLLEIRRSHDGVERMPPWMQES
jgi:S-methylmethionine-dependent homocysteine/selenocysteine methylase/precorrin-6B methylase 2